MTRQQQNDVILRSVSEELKDTPNAMKRVGIAFNKWFQALATPPPVPIPAPTQEGEGEPAASE